MAVSSPRLTVNHRLPGRALFASSEALYRSLHMQVFRSSDQGATWQAAFRLPMPLSRRAVEPSRLACRLTRHEVRALLPMPGGGYLCCSRQGLYRVEPGSDEASPVVFGDEGPDPRLPGSLCAAPDGRVVWGEYWSNKSREAVRLFGSEDGGRTHRVVHSFDPGEIRHVHGLLFDPGLDAFWVFAGDHGAEPGIGLLSGDLQEFRWLLKGQQRHRVVCAFDLGQHLVYGTDTEKEANAIYRLDKKTLELTRLVSTDGSCIHGCRSGSGFVLSTTAEPRDDDSPQVASLWASGDGEAWEKVYTVDKDRWQANLFQFGSLVLPRGQCPPGLVMFSGQAVAGVDGEVLVASLEAS